MALLQGARQQGFGAGPGFVLCGYTAPGASQICKCDCSTEAKEAGTSAEAGGGESVGPQKGPLSNLTQATETDSAKS